MQVGLTRLFPIFNRQGWFWGAGFPIEDGMHFECGDDMIRGWARDGLIGAVSEAGLPNILSLGDRGPDVTRLQEALRAKGAADGDFGRGTQAAVMAFQSANGLTVDGVVGQQTLKKLGIG